MMRKGSTYAFYVCILVLILVTPTILLPETEPTMSCCPDDGQEMVGATNAEHCNTGQKSNTKSSCGPPPITFPMIFGSFMSPELGLFIKDDLAPEPKRSARARMPVTRAVF